MEVPKGKPSVYDVMRAHGISRRDFLNFCTRTTALMGLSATMVPQVVEALTTQPRIPVIWLHGLECTCCTESLIRSATPLAQDLLLNMISLDYDDTLQAAAGFQVEEIRKSIMAQYAGQYLLAVEGATPTGSGGVYCTVGGKTFLNTLQETAKNARAIIAYGSCSAGGCLPSAKPNPTNSLPLSALMSKRLIPKKPLINVPGCPPVAEVIAGVMVYIITQNKLPELDSSLRPKSYYDDTVHDECPRKGAFGDGRFVENWDDAGARQGWCLFKMGCRGPLCHNVCSKKKWNGGTSWCVQSGHGCIGCAEANFYDVNGPLYQQVAYARKGDD